MTAGWIGVDLDGTLAQYTGWQGPEHIGEPVPKMLERVKRWLDEGYEVKIFTARMSGPRADITEVERMRTLIENWCEEHLGKRLEVTCIKDYGMIELWDDRAVQVRLNTGERVGESTRGLE